MPSKVSLHLLSFYWKYLTVSSIDSWLPSQNWPQSLAYFCTALLVRCMNLLLIYAFFSFLGLILSSFFQSCWFQLVFYTTYFYQIAKLYFTLANREQPCLKRKTLRDFLPLILMTLTKTHTRMSNLNPSISKGLSIYYWMMKLFGDMLSLYIFTLIQKADSLNNLPSCFKDENKWIPRPLLREVGFKIHIVSSVQPGYVFSSGQSDEWKELSSSICALDYSLLICLFVMFISMKQFLMLMALLLGFLASFLRQYLTNQSRLSSTAPCSCLKSMMKDLGMQLPIDYGQHFLMFLYNFYLLVNYEWPSRQLQMVLQVSTLFFPISGRWSSYWLFDVLKPVYFWLLDCNQQI